MATRGDPRAAKESRNVSDRAVMAIAKKEFMEYTRRPWILALSLTFALLMVGGSYLVSLLRGPEGEAVGFVATIGVVRSIVGLLIPIIAIILAHSALAGEQESGSLGLLLSQPTTRSEVVLGKFIGLYGVVGGAIVLGFGLSSLVVAARTPDPEWADFGRFLIATLLYAAAYFALFFLFSGIASRRTPALLYAIGVWAFFGFVFDLLIAAVAFGVNGVSAFTEGNVPQWLVAIQFLSIPNLYDGLIAATSRALRDAAAQSAGFRVSFGFLDESWAPAAITAALLAWTVGSLALTSWLVGRKDV